ncbi:ABC transporter ATP-binding protein [Tabrizicola oligotrophica]|uniref:ABC transporter ATP-binding protein n=1 Tax=Tabrizicola oligotrophica TaxID=2710650 RepID=A0A6M0QPS2_9RHOB|nr:ABC transporter ATP-binding protein [Tabrizicola oligotrophica]NEY89478.1 ABC transporter ATP-binding protein [Tabrizicola oligotrophica]
MNRKAIVALEGVSKSYGAVQALGQTDLVLNEGEFVTLLGPSGCGKTTTLRMVGGFEFPSTGRILIDGRDTTYAAPFDRPVNTVFQDYALFPHMTVAQNIRYGLTVRGANLSPAEVSSRVEHALALVGLSKFADRRPAMMSGGQRQRVAMARAIARRPRVLLLDEPLSALDVKLREGMQVELKRIHRELGITFLMVTHDQGEAMALSDRVVVMQAGQICQTGKPEELYDSPANPYVADFIGGANLVKGVWKGRDRGRDRLALGQGQAEVQREGHAVAGLSEGAAVLIGLRPDNLLLGDGPNAISGRVLEVLFRGDRIRIEFTPRGIAAPIFAEVPRAALRDLQNLGPGSPVTFHIDAADILLFADEVAK